MNNFKVAFMSSFITIILVVSAYLIINGNGTTSSAQVVQDSTQENTSDNPNTVPASYEDRMLANDAISNQRRNIITKTVKEVSPAVVGINVKEVRQYRSPWSNDPFWRYFFGSGIYNREIQSIGSGVIISPDGYIVTNDHVAGTADEILIVLADGRHLKAEKIGTDATTDICLLKVVDGVNLPYIRLGDSDDVLIGEWSIAIGNPFGLFSQTDKPTVTVGVVSATGMNLSPINGRYYMNMIQTDASINRGNSGGPLVNSVGEMIGMNTIIFTADGSNGNVGVGFAIPINKIKKIVNKLKENGKVDRNYWTGLIIQEVDQQIADYFNLQRARGVIVKEIQPNSPAENAGLKIYDIITELNGVRVNNSQILQGLLFDHQTGESVKLTIIRDGEILHKTLKLERKV